ncbi:hypothetical protein [Nonomuraea sp. NPDC049709]|uniref:hypothetical protein n=1 Tax=Nonomuraea sp. NPDC049709 TaxID=3154736 RepID=UPI00341A8397
MNSGNFPSSSAPLQLAAGESSQFIDIETTDSNRTMLVRVTAFAPDGHNDGGRPPLIHLAAGTGPVVEVTEFPETQQVADAENHIAGSATWMRKNLDVYLVRVALDRPGSNWRIQIVNDDSDTRTFQFMSLGGAKIRDESDWPDSDLIYCGSFPCACTRHEGSLTTECPSCGHKSQPA